MSIKGKYKVKSIDKAQCTDWLLHKHYAKRRCPVSYSFGLFNFENILVGCAAFGGSANRNNNNIGEFDIIELNRLVVNDGLEKNVLSFFVSNCLKMLPKPCIVLSYADPNNGHHGYIYQATNWLYFGQGQRKDGGTDTGVTAFIKDGKPYHSKSITKITGGSTSKEAAEKFGFIRTFTPPKHKYMFLNGNKYDKKKMIEAIPYKEMEYPKGQNTRYDASYKPTVQIGLF
jgi:hypothetical protein